MDEKSQEMSQDEKDMRLVLKCKTLENLAKEARRKFDWAWVVRNLYVRGYHFANYNQGTNTITFSTRSGVQIPINLVQAHLRGVRNQVTAFSPKWEVMPSVTTDEAFQNARLSGRVLDYIYEKSQIKRKVKEIVNDALITSIGIWHFDIDSANNIVISRVDPLDFWVDPNIKSPNINDPEYGAEFVLCANQTSVDAIRKNKKYEHTEELHADNKLAAAEYKQFYLQVVKNQTGGSSEKENETIILKQMQLRERDENGNIKLRNVHYVDQVSKPLFQELIDTTEYDYEIMQGDIQPGELYGESWIKHLIPINRVIDSLESHIFEYNHFFAKGKWIIDKNSGVRLIVNQNGQIMEKNRGSTVTPVTVPPLPPSPETQIARMSSRLEDISGVHDVSLGRLPGTIRSGTAIAELRQADSTNQADLVDNMEDFLSRSGRKILALVADNWTTTKLIVSTAMGGSPDYFMAVGESGKNGSKNKFKMGDRELPLAVISRENEVRVQVGSWLAYTKEARQDKLKEYFRLGAIDQKTFLSHAEFADIDGIMDRTREERILQNFAGSKSEAVQREYGITLDDESIALAENELMIEGIEQHAQAKDNHQVHIMVHQEEEKNKSVQAHIKEHEQFIRWQQKMKASPVPSQEGQIPAPPLSGGLPGEMGGGVLQGEAPPTTFPMNPPVGPGAPPFNPAQDIIQGGPLSPTLMPIGG